MVDDYLLEVLEGGVGRKRRLQLVESGQCSSHAIGSQQEETRDAALEENIPHGITHDDDAIEPPETMGHPYRQSPASETRGLSNATIGEPKKGAQDLVKEGTMFGSHGRSIFWAPDDAYAQLMGQEHHGRASDQRVVELEDQIATLTQARVEDGNKIDALIQVRVEDANASPSSTST
nr:hypothetical protein CFP56_18279 [Quercus suber]